MSKATSGKNNPNYGKKHSEETRRKQSDAHKGEKHGMSKLTEEQVIEIRNIKNKTLKEIAKMFNVSIGCITGIINRINWKYI